MNNLVLTLVFGLALGAIISSLYKSPLLDGLHTRLVALTAPRTVPPPNPPGGEVTYGCGATPEAIEPMVPMTPKQEAAYEKAEKRQDAIENKKVAARLHRFISLGMSQTQVRRVMGEPGMDGSSIVEAHPSDNADYYADYEIAYSVQGKVIWVGSI